MFCQETALRPWIGGWGETGKSFRVVPCVRTCVRAVLGLVRFQPNRAACSFPFPFCPAGFSLFPCASICSLFHCEHHEEKDSNEIKWIHMKSNEITWYQMKSRETKWIKVKSNEINWTQMTSSEFKWNQMNSNEFKWNQMNSNGNQINQMNSNEINWRPPPSPQSSYPNLVGFLGYIMISLNNIIIYYYKVLL